MGKTAIMTDSNCGIMPSEEEKYGIHILPMPVIIDGKTYREGMDITLQEFFQRQSQGCLISTSQPSPADVAEMWDSLLKDYDEVLFIPMSSGLSSTCQTARMLAEEEIYMDRVFVADNHRISVTQAMSALEAKKHADNGKTAEQIKRILEKEALDATIYISVDTLEYLKKGGRISAAAAALGTVLRLKPVLTIQGEKLEFYTKARGMKAAFQSMLGALRHDLETRLAPLRQEGKLKVGIANTAMEAGRLESFRKELEKNFPDMELVYFPLTASIGTHVGPGGLGIGAVRAE